MKEKSIILIACIFFAFFLIPIANAPFNTSWWNTSWQYRVGLDVNTTQYSRTHWPIEHEMNFTALIQSLGISGTFDPNSTRVIEHNSTGHAIREITSQFDQHSTFNSSTNAAGTIIFFLNGTTAANTVRNFFVYFDTIENGPKQDPGYTSDLVSTWDGEELSVNNSIVELYIDTIRGQNTSGIYKAVEINTILTADSGETTAEYTQYSNGTHNFSFDFRNNASFTSGPVRIIMEQIGDEVFWNQSDNKTGVGRMVKKYTFYNNTQWIRIEQNFTNIGSSNITRNSTLAGALLINLSTLISSTSDNTRKNNETDPGSWTWAAEQFGLVHVGVINENETGTNNFVAINQSLSGTVNYGRMGIGLNTTTIEPGSSITQTAVVHFEGNFGDVNVVTALRNRLLNPVNISQQAPEALEVRIDANTNASIYNRGETVLITGNATYDPFTIVNEMNATLDMGTPGTSDDLTLVLYDDGTNGDQTSDDKLFTNIFNITTNLTLGQWQINVRSYDGESAFLNESNTTFNITNIYNTNLTIHIPSILVSSFINATFVVQNFRNDSLISGVNVTCVSGGNPIQNITDLNNGSYLINFTSSPTPGMYNLTCTGEKLNNTGSSDQNYTAETPTTSLSMSTSPSTFTSTQITQTSPENFDVAVNMTNTGNATASSVNVSVSLPTNWTSNSSLESCASILLASSCIHTFNITIPNATSPGEYQVNFTVDWENPNTSTSTNTTTLNITVQANPQINISESQVSGEVGDGLEMVIGNFTVLSIGNNNLANITFNVTNLGNFTITFSPVNISFLTEGTNQSVQVNVTVPLAFSTGTYTGTLNVSSTNDGFQIINLTIIVPNVTFVSLQQSPLNFTSTQITQTSPENFDVAINMTNTGNATARSTNISIALPGSFISNITTANCNNITPDSSCIGSFNITIPNATSPGEYQVNFTVDWENPNTSTSTNTTTLNITVQANPQINISESQVSGEVGDGSENILGNFTVLSIGNNNLANITFNVTNLGNFTITFSPVNISFLTEGTNQSVQVNVTVPLGLATGNYTGTLNVSSTNDGFQIINITIEVPENRTWSMSPISCQQVEVPDEGGVCNVTVTNQGNTIINFTISPTTGNYTTLSATNFSIQADNTFNFTVSYNVTNVTKAIYNSTFVISANHTNATPLNATLSVQLIPFIIPLISLSVPSEIPQLNFTDILVNVTDRSGTGINITTINITTTNNTVWSFTVTNITTTGNLTQGQLTYPQINSTNSTHIGSTFERGVYSVLAFTEDNSGANETVTSNFTVFANFSTTISTLQSSYAQGTTATVYYKSTDINATPLEGASVTLTVTDSLGNVTFNDSFTTDSNGIISPLSQFAIANDAPLGTYNLTSVSRFYDSIANVTVNSTSETTFQVTSTTSGDGLFANVETTVIWYPNNVMKFNILVLNSAGTPLDPDTMVLTVYNPANALYTTANLSDMAKVDTGLYNYSYAMPLSTSTGAYLAVLNITKNSLTSIDINPFIVTAGGPFDLVINLHEPTVPKGDYLDFDLSIENKGEIDIDVLVEYWVTQGTTTWFYSSETILARSFTNTSIVRNAFIFASQTVGLATLNAKVTFDSIQPAVIANETFQVTESSTPPTPPPPPASPPTTTVAPSITNATYELAIIDYPKTIDIVRGWSDIYSVQVKNNGNQNLRNVSILITGIPSTWITITPPLVELLTSGNTSVFIVDVTIPANTLTQEYDLSLSALSDKTSDLKSMTLTVFKSQYDLLSSQIKTLKKELEKLETDTKAADQIGKNVEKVFELIVEIKKQIGQAETNLAEALYQKATDNVVTAFNLIDAARKLLADAQFKAQLEAQIVPLWQIILVIVALGAINVFLFLWLKGFNKKFGEYLKPYLSKEGKQKKFVAEAEGTEKEMLRQERERITRMMRLLDKEVREGVITKNAYEELKKKSEEKIRNINKKLKRKWI